MADNDLSQGGRDQSGQAAGVLHGDAATLRAGQRRFELATHLQGPEMQHVREQTGLNSCSRL